MSPTMRRVLETAETWMRFSKARWSQGGGRRSRSLPEEEGKGDWRGAGHRCASGSRGLFDLLQVKTEERIREVRRVKEEGVVEEEGARAHRQRRIWPEMSAGLRSSIERFCCGLLMVSRESKERRERGVRGLFMGEDGVEKGLGFHAGDRRLGRLPCGKRRSARGEGWQVGLACQREEEGLSYRFGTVSRWAVGLMSGQAETFPLAFFIVFLFMIPFLFLFSGLFHIFCKFDSNQFKRISKFF
jgi:hypothetical protein